MSTPLDPMRPLIERLHMTGPLSREEASRAVHDLTAHGVAPDRLVAADTETVLLLWESLACLRRYIATERAVREAFAKTHADDSDVQRRGVAAQVSRWDIGGPR